MRKLIFSIILCSFVGSLFLANSRKADLTPLDIFFFENPELLPETISVCEKWHEVELNNDIINAVIRSNIKPILEHYRLNTRKLIYVSQYNCSTYYFCLVSPSEDVPFKIERDSEGTTVKTSIVGYNYTDSLYILFDENIKGLRFDSLGQIHKFQLKLLIDKAQDEKLEWWATRMNDTSIRVFSIFNEQPLSGLLEIRLRECLEAMDKHDF